jgi:hypothetical protein
LALALVQTTSAWCHQAPHDDRYLHPNERRPPSRPPLRPRLEVTSWVGLGGGAIVADAASRGVFDLRLGGGFNGAISRSEDVRLGPFIEAASSTFASIQAVGGVELFLGATPRPLRMFYYTGEGTIVVRAGAGWAWRRDLPGASSTPVASLTLAYGYRCPFSLREPPEDNGDKPGVRPLARYMVGVRLWVNSTVDLTGDPAWQLTGGLEFEPVGAFRYILGLY